MTNVWKAPADIDDDDDNLLIDDSDGSDLEVSGLGNSRTNNYSNQGFIQPDHQIESDIPATPAPKSVPTNPTTSANAAAASSSFMSNQPPPAYSLDSAFTTTTGDRVEQRRFMGGDTLDEPVTATLMRDVRGVGHRLRQVIWYSPATSLREARGLDPEAAGGFGYDPNAAASAAHLTRQEWDLWGPLVFCLVIAVAMSMLAPNHQASEVFSGVFVLVWLGQMVVTLNIRLLGGNILFFHAMCVTGYCLFPLVIAAIISACVGSYLVRIIADTILVAWAIFSATMGLKHSGVLPSRVFLAMYPVGLFYTGLGWLCVIT
ncbi:uncharacterized protein SAPINGB_P003222 [Magnusiomyces paraingens]|uniref:Protein YIP n=1 Tax=Magnusiomyces paraingens TaxID=2606893 RepID=A0A5E8BQL4_9ASCO|nr:uncharacterized protein SAPINGB_P003222 [Saprochaete ingens]VVT51815.1 unnamed protein product [Saprochaete ingens]